MESVVLGGHFTLKSVPIHQKSSQSHQFQNGVLLLRQERKNRRIEAVAENSAYTASLPPSFSSIWTIETANPAVKSSPKSGKGWVRDGKEKDAMVEAKARVIAVMAADRAEMHTNIGIQRDNWNKLFQATIGLATISAALIGAAAAKSAGSAIAIALLNGISAAMMMGINYFQPSQLAEEQRGAARFLKNLGKEIEATLQIDPSLREDAELFLQDKLQRLESIRSNYPLPLTPNGLEKFPDSVSPISFTPIDLSVPVVQIHSPSNGWNQAMVEDLQTVCCRIRTKDMRAYVELGNRALWINRILAVSAPACAFSAAAASILCINSSFNPSTFVTVCSVLAFFVSSFSHDAQIGMIFEMYRTCASAYRDMEAMIQRNLRLPVEKRMNGELFHQVVALLLGRTDQIPMVPDDGQNAGLVF